MKDTCCQCGRRFDIPSFPPEYGAHFCDGGCAQKFHVEQEEAEIKQAKAQAPPAKPGPKPKLSRREALEEWRKKKAIEGRVFVDPGRLPDYRMKMRAKSGKAHAEIGCGWLNEDLSVSFVLNPGVKIDHYDCEKFYLVLFPIEEPK